MTSLQPKARMFHPAAVAIFVAGIAVFIVGVIRVNFIGPSLNVQPSIAQSRPTRDPYYDPLRIVVTIPPLLWTVKLLAPSQGEITLLVPVGSGCEGLDLTPSQVLAARRAHMRIRAGAGIDNGIPPNEDGIQVFDFSLDDSVESTAVADNPHRWLDAEIMERFIERLATEWPYGDRERARRLSDAANLKRVCREIDAEYRERLAPFNGQSIVTHHDAWSHLARRYGLEVAAVIQHTHDAEPSPADLADAARIIKEKGVKAIFIEPQLNPAAASRIAEITGANVLTLDPLGDGDWPAMMRNNLDALVEGLSAPQKDIHHGGAETQRKDGGL